MIRKSVRLEEYDYSEPGAYFITICTNKRVPRFGTITNNDVNLNEIGIIAKQFWCEITEHFENVELGEFILMPNHLHGIIIINEERLNNKVVILNDGRGTTPEDIKGNVQNKVFLCKESPGDVGVILNDGRGTAPTKNLGVILNDGRGTTPTKNFGVIANDGRGTACRAPTEELGDSPRGDGPNSFRGSRAPAEEMKSSRIESRAPTEEMTPSRIESRTPTEEGKVPRLEGFQKPAPGSIPTIIRSYKSAVTREIHRFLGSNDPVWQRGYYEHVIRSEKEWGMIHDYIDANPMNWDQDKIGKHEWMQRKIG